LKAYNINPAVARIRRVAVVETSPPADVTIEALNMPRRSASRTVSVAPMERRAAPRWLRPLLLSLAAILQLSLFTGEIRDTDIWLHLKTGQHSLETRALTVPDPFSY